MPIRVVHVCPKCGQRNESPDLNPGEMMSLAFANQLLAEGYGTDLCTDCQGKPKRRATAEGEARARANRSS